MALHFVTVLMSVLLSGLIVWAASRRWKPPHRFYWAVVPLLVSPCVTLAMVGLFGLQP